MLLIKGCTNLLKKSSCKNYFLNFVGLHGCDYICKDGEAQKNHVIIIFKNFHITLKIHVTKLSLLKNDNRIFE